MVAMLRTTALILSLGAANAALELTADTWKTEVTDSGKSAFIKFLAPW